MKYLLELGRLQELSVYEAAQIFDGYPQEPLAEKFLAVEVDDESKVLEIVERSGGISRAFKAIKTVQKDELLPFIVEYLKDLPKPTFSFTSHNTEGNSVQLSPQEIKNELKKLNVSSRFIEKSSTAFFLHHQNTIDLHAVVDGENVLLAQTIWVQNIDEWTVRDRSKPYRDRKKGMLPPKLARMMVNFVSPDIQKRTDKLLYDPFCGTGTVLMEASMLGWDIGGSDLAGDAVHGTATNMHWFSQLYGKPEPKALFIADATHLDLKQLPGKIDAIVTEPFLGKPQPKTHDLPNIFKGLEKLYLGSFKQWKQILKDGGEVILVTPLVETPQKTFSLARFIDNLPSLGYNLVSGPMVYRREQTIVQRAIYKLKLQTKN